MKLSEMIEDVEAFKTTDVNVFMVLQSQPEVIRESADEKDIPVTLICDPDMKIFHLYKVYPGTLFGYITPGVIKRAIRAKKLGFIHGKNEGKEFQLPAVFLIDTDKIISYVYYGKHIADIPDNSSLLSTIKNIKGDMP